MCAGYTYIPGHGNPLQYSCLENPMDRGAWHTIVHRVAKNWTRLNWVSDGWIQSLMPYCVLSVSCRSLFLFGFILQAGLYPSRLSSPGPWLLHPIPPLAEHSNISGVSVSWTMFSEKAMAPHSSTLAWKIPLMEEPGGLHTVHGVAKSWTWLNNFTFTFHFHALEKEMATHFKCSCLENPRDGGSWWAAVYGVAESDMTEVT